MGSIGVRPEIKKETPHYSEELIQQSFRFCGILSNSTIKYRTENLNIYSWESDALYITKSGYAYEFEIKISRSDFKNDFKHKAKKHQILESSDVGITNRPNYFFYVVPEGMVKVEEVPEYAGLIYVIPHFRPSDGTIYRYSFNVVKEAKKLHKTKVDEEALSLKEKFYYNYSTWKYKYEKDLTSYKEKLDEAKTVDGTKYKHTLPQAMEQLSFLKSEVDRLGSENETWKISYQKQIALLRRYRHKLFELGVDVDSLDLEIEKYYE